MQGPELRLVLAAYLILINLVGFFSMGADKRKARRGKWRTPEATLFLIALLGGSLGSLAGMRAFHHKTKHNRFRFGVPAIFLLQAAAALYGWIRFG